MKINSKLNLSLGTLAVLILIAGVLFFFLGGPKAVIDDEESVAEFPSAPGVDESIVVKEEPDAFGDFAKDFEKKLEHARAAVEEGLLNRITTVFSEEGFAKDTSLLLDYIVAPFVEPDSPSMPIDVGEEGVESKPPAVTATSVPEPVEEKEELTEEEIVKMLYPDYYLEHLDYLQDLAISGGIISTSERSAFDTRESIQEFHLRYIEYLASINIITPAEKDNFVDGIESVLPQMQEIDLEFLGTNEQGSAFAGYLVMCTEDKRDGSLPSEAAWFFKPLFDKLGIRPAHAADCFRSGSGGSLGSNLWAPCCNCRIPCGKTTCPIGCLNLVCVGRPAIWDPATGICGCG